MNSDEILVGLGRLEGKLDTLIKSQGRLESELKDLTRRVGSPQAGSIFFGTLVRKDTYKHIIVFNNKVRREDYPRH